jgi:hypothetical protein
VAGRFRRLRTQLTGAPQEDPGKVGISFVDVLFALVVGEVLSPLRRWWTIPGPAWSHLVLAAVLVLTSWIGYHNSTNKPKYEIAFVNLPLWQFVLDISMVIAYWFTATSAELPEHSPLKDLPAPRGSAVPEAILVAVCFLLYVLWDEVGRQIKKSPFYGASSPSASDGARRIVTWCCFVATLVIVGLAIWAEASDQHWGIVIALDIALIALLIGFRVLKEVVTLLE